jgi:hypothetical protein
MSRIRDGKSERASGGGYAVVPNPTRNEVAHMGAVIADEVNAVKAFAARIKAVAQANDARIAAEVDAITDSFSILVKVVRSLNERVADLERKADEMCQPKGAFSNTVWAPVPERY